MTDLDAKLLAEIRRVATLANTHPIGTKLRAEYEEEVRRSLAVLADGHERRMSDRLFHLKRVRDFDPAIDVPVAGYRVVMAY